MYPVKATISHIGINLSNSGESFQFWKDLLSYLDFKIIEAGAEHFDANDGDQYLCVGVTEAKYQSDTFHRKHTGLNHIAFQVSSPQHVDQFATNFLVSRKIEPLYGGAKGYPEYVDGYYAVFFEDPDRIKVEVVFEPRLG